METGREKKCQKYSSKSQGSQWSFQTRTQDRELHQRYIVRNINKYRWCIQTRKTLLRTGVEQPSELKACLKEQPQPRQPLSWAFSWSLVLFVAQVEKELQSSLPPFLFFFFLTLISMFLPAVEGRWDQRAQYCSKCIHHLLSEGTLSIPVLDVQTWSAAVDRVRCPSLRPSEYLNTQNCQMEHE